jgi:hypothetical protein
MNSSMAVEFLGLTDLLLTSGFTNFLGDPLSTVDLTPPAISTAPCRINYELQGAESNCKRRYFLPGPKMFIAPELTTDQRFPTADIVLVTNHQGFLLDFDAGDSKMKFDPVTNCRVYSGRYWGEIVGATRLCVGNSNPNQLQAR